MTSNQKKVNKPIMAMIRAIAGALSPKGGRARLSILVYHRVLPQPDPMLQEEPDAETFSWQMRLLAENFTVLPLTEAIDRLQRSELPQRAVCITFDDGYADNAEIALPILVRWGLPATFFVASGYLDRMCMWNDMIIETVRRAQSTTLESTDPHIGTFSIGSLQERYDCAVSLVRTLRRLPPVQREDKARALAVELGVELTDRLMMSSAQVRMLSQAGMEIGAHTVNHPILTEVDERIARTEIHEGREILEHITRTPVHVFAYPNGKPEKDYDSRHVALVKSLGFSAAVSTAWGAAGIASDIYQLPRFTPWDKTPARFGLRLLHNYLRR